ncbi:hypothetical protein PISL3812_00935 [Talaromyces islandicus]|uniref:RRM domain-containing protein n=1 Tax=Talaromyces islandicus TaxID=28573 RepID=A0A0U1LLC3_TALIS|nr:hypothetical protein PISL3812_00935 [Talaromyces islandicus]
MSSEEDTSTKKRKLNDGPEIEIDVSAPEPPSKKALRKAKKMGIDPAKVAEKKEAEQPSNKRSPYGVWIGNMPFSTTKEDLRKFFTSNCTFTDTTITRIHLPQGPSKHGMAQNKGFAYVDFATQKAMDEAIGLSELLILGRRVLIKGAQNFQGRPDQHQQAGASKATATSAHPPSKRIFVGNLGFDATKEALEEHFAPCGTVVNIHLATFEDSGKCKGYGWVEFETVDAAQHAVDGFVKVADDEDEDEDEAVEDDDNSDSDETKSAKNTKPKKPKTKKIWVNRLLGRQLRMEFAEDAATRYKKRFGKEGKGRSEDQTEEGGEQNRRAQRPKVDKTPSRYSKDTVQRLTGAIVEAKGQKVTFD